MLAVIAHLDAQLDRGWTVPELAATVGLSPSRLRHLFVAQTGLSPLEYLKQRRMTEAERLLVSSHLRVKEIMREVGIADSSHFTRDFTARFGSSPTEYRRSKLIDAVEIANKEAIPPIASP